MTALLEIKQNIKRFYGEYEVYILYGVRPLTPDNVSNLFDKRVHLIFPLDQQQYGIYEAAG